MNLLRRIAQSLHNPLFYKQIFIGGQGIGLKYLLQLLALCWFVVALVLTLMVLQARKNPESPLMLPVQILHKVSPQFPLVTIKEGKAAVEGGQPVTIYDPANGQPLMIVDTSPKPIQLEKTKAQVLMTSSTLKIHYDGEDITYDFPEKLNGTIDSRKVEEWANFMERVMPYAPFIMLPVDIISHLLALTPRWLIMAAVAFLTLKPRIEATKFEACLRIVAYAMTPSILLKILIVSSGYQPFGAPEMLLLAITVLYLFFAVSSVLGKQK